MPLLLSSRAHAVPPLPLYTRDDARMLGIRLDDPGWRRLRRNVYVAAHPYAELPPWKRYAVRVHAYLRTHPDAVLCLESAAVLHGLPGFGETRFIHVYDPDLPRSQRYGDVRVHTSRDGRGITRVSGVLVTDLRDTVVDLARVVTPAEGLAVADAAISRVQGGSLQLNDLRVRSEGLVDRRGRARMQWVWDNADGLAESPAESVSRAVIIWSGFESPELQREFHYDGHSDRCDFYFRGCRGIGEADGWEKYRLEDAGQAARALRDEKRREDRLRRHRHPFARWEPSDAWKVAPLCTALESAGIPRLQRPNAAMLATLSHRPRARA